MKRLTALVLFFTALVSLIGLLSFNYFEKNKSNTPLNHHQGKIIIGTETWPGYIALYVAKKKGYFKDEGLDVNIERYITLGKLSEDYLAGKMQGRANLTLEAVNESLKGFDHKIVLAIDYSNGADAIVASKDIKSVKEFVGKRVVFEKGTLEEFFLSWALSQQNLHLSQLLAIEGDPDKAKKSLLANEADIAVTHEPFLGDLLKDPRFAIVVSSENAPGLITDVLTFRTDFIKSHPDSVRSILKAYFRALDFVKSNPNESYQILAKEFEIDASSLPKQFEGIQMLDKRDNLTSFSYGSGFSSLYSNLKLIESFVANQKHTRQLDTDDLIEPTFIKEIND